MPKLPNINNHDYWLAILMWARSHSDGCTGVPDFYLEACSEHDFHYRYGMTLYGQPITFREANTRFRRVIQMLSWWGVLSPVSWWRWAGVSIGGRRIWRKHRAKNETPPGGLISGIRVARP